MRRNDREITDIGQIRQVLDTCMVCRLGIYDETAKEIYMVPMNFAYSLEGRDLTLYFHSAPAGRKIELLKKNPNVSFEMDCGHQLVAHERPCGHSFRYSCLMGSGTAFFIHEPSLKAAALSRLMEKQTEKPWQVTEAQAASVAVFQVIVRDFSGKARN